MSVGSAVFVSLKSRFPAIPQVLARCAATCLLAGCASLPHDVVRTPTQALPAAEVAGSALAKLVEPGHAAGESGFRLLPTGVHAFNTRVALARRAEFSLDLQYYVIHDDETGRALLQELEAAAERGVRVRLLVDDIATETQDQSLLRLASLPNIQVRIFNPFAWGRSSASARILSSLGDLKRINHRMHNKSFIADNAMAVTGGRNLGDEYFMVASSSNFIDLDVFAAGPVVHDLSDVFDRYWNSEYVYPIANLVRYDAGAAEKAARMRALPPTPAMSAMRTPDGAAGLATADGPQAWRGIDMLGHPSLIQGMDDGRLQLTWAPARVVADAPSKVAGVTDATVGDTASGMLMSLMDAAQTEVVVVSPYFVPGKPGMRLMRKLQARGVQMVVLTNSLAATDTPIVHTGYARYRVEMLRLGVHLYELSPTRGHDSAKFGLFGSSRAKLHAKTAVIDRSRLFVGSINLDARSARENTEQGVVIDSPQLAGEVLQLLENDHGESAYRLRLAPDGYTIQWIATNAGIETATGPEPDAPFWLRLGVWLLGPIAPEELL